MAMAGGAGEGLSPPNTPYSAGTRWSPGLEGSSPPSGTRKSASTVGTVGTAGTGEQTGYNEATTETSGGIGVRGDLAGEAGAAGNKAGT